MSYNSYRANFGASVNQITSGGKTGGAAGSSRTSNGTVSKPTFWQRVFGATDAVITHDSGKPIPKVDRVIKVRDGNASASQQITGSAAEYYRTYEGAGETFVEKINLGSVLDILRKI